MMKTISAILLTFALAACSSAPEPVPVPASALEEHPGASFAEAVVVPPDAPNEGATFESEWIYEHFGAFRKQNGGMTANNGRHFDVITFQTRDGASHTVYFDTSDLWNALYPPRK